MEIREPPFGISQVRVPNGNDKRPVLAHGTPLKPPPAEPNRLQRAARDPDRREEVTVETPHDNLSAHDVTATSGDDGPNDQEPNNENAEGNRDYR